MAGCSLRCIAIGVAIGVVSVIALGWAYRFFVGPMLALFRPQSVSQKTSKTPWQMLARAVWSIIAAVVIVGVILFVSTPEQQQEILAALGDVLSLTISMASRLVRLVWQLVRSLWQIALGLVRWVTTGG